MKKTTLRKLTEIEDATLCYGKQVYSMKQLMNCLKEKMEEDFASTKQLTDAKYYFSERNTTNQ